MFQISSSAKIVFLISSQIKKNLMFPWNHVELCDLTDFFLVYFEILIWSSVYNLVLILLVFSFSSSEDFKSLDETRRTIRLETRRCLSEILNEVPPPPLPLPPISQVRAKIWKKCNLFMEVAHCLYQRILKRGKGQKVLFTYSVFGYPKAKLHTIQTQKNLL